MTGVHNIAVGSVRLRRSGVWLGVFALLFQAMLPLSGMPLMPGSPGLLEDDPSICYVDAPQQEDPARRGSGDGDRDTPPCPICQVLQQFGNYLPPAAGTVATQAGVAATGETPRDPLLPPHRTVSSCWVRAPPHSA